MPHESCVNVIFSMLKRTDKKYSSNFSLSYHYIIWNVTSNQALFKVVVLDSWNTHLRMKLQLKVSIFVLFYTTLSLPSLEQASKMSAFNKYHGLKHSNSADGRTIRYDNDEVWNLKIIQCQQFFKQMTNFFKDFSRRKTNNEITKIVRILFARTPQRKNHKKDQKRRQAIYLRHFLFK